MVIKWPMLVVGLRNYSQSKFLLTKNLTEVNICFKHYSLLSVLGQTRVGSYSHRQDAREAKNIQ